MNGKANGEGNQNSMGDDCFSCFDRNQLLGDFPVRWRKNLENADTSENPHAKEISLIEWVLETNRTWARCNFLAMKASCGEQLLTS